MTKEMRKKLVPWALVFAFCLPYLIPWAWAKVVPAARWARDADYLYTGATNSDGTKEYVIGSSLFDSLGTLDSTALGATNNRTLIKNAISVATADLNILGAWTFSDSLTIAQDAVFTGGTGSGVTINAPTTINDTLTVADSASFTNDLVSSSAFVASGTSTISGTMTVSGRLILPLHTIAAGDSVVGHMILDAADTTLKVYVTTWETVAVLTD
jgi:hypothetical protein